MKAGIISLIGILILILTGIIIFTVTGRNIRQSELSESLTSAIEQTMQVAYIEKSYEIKDREHFIADFTANLLTQLNSECDIEIHILNADFVNGCMDVEAVRKFQHFSGKEGEVKVRKTVIFEQFKDSNNKVHLVTFLDSKGSMIKTMQVYHEGHIQDPTIKPDNFKRWHKRGDDSWDGDLKNIVVTEDMTFDAVIEEGHM